MNETFSISDENIQKLTKTSTDYSKIISNVIEEIKKNIVGQDEVIRKIIISIIADGHVLLESVPGLAKTLMIKTMADIFSVNNVRIQFTPDLLPADILGTKIYKNNSETFEIQKGPIFHNFVLADEINRAPPKVQSALLESMQEKQEKFLRAHLSYYMKDDRQKVKIVMTPIPNPNITLNPVIPTYTSAIENPLSPTSKVIEVVPSVEHVPVPIPRPVRPNPLISTPILSPDLQNDLPFIPINGPPILPPALSPISAVTPIHEVSPFLLSNSPIIPPFNLHHL